MVKLDEFHSQMRVLVVQHHRYVQQMRQVGVKKPDTTESDREINALLEKCGSEICDQCGDIFCPNGDALHFHHDGCPCCSFVEYSDARWSELLLARNSR